MKYLKVDHVLRIHQRVIETSGGDPAIRDLGLIDSAVAQPRMAFGGQALYPTLVEKAAALGFSLIMNHGFVDGNKRTGHAAMEMFLLRNGYEIHASDDDQEETVLRVAAGLMDREEFTDWLRARLVRKRR
jgi:death-on-curing protein